MDAQRKNWLHRFGVEPGCETTNTAGFRSGLSGGRACKGVS